MQNLRDRIKCRKLEDKVASPEKAANLIQNGMTVGINSGIFSICEALKEQGRKASDLAITFWSSSAFVKPDQICSSMIQKRIGQQIYLKKAINSSNIDYLDVPLGFFHQSIRSGEFGCLDLAILEGVGITEEGNLIPSYRLGDIPNFAQAAKELIIYLNTYYPLEFQGMHDIYLPENPPNRKIIPLSRIDERIGKPFVPINAEKVKYIVVADAPEPIDISETVDITSVRISENLLSFFWQEVSMNRLPRNLLPIETGLGSIPAAVLRELGKSEFENLGFFSAILNDGILDLIDRGKVTIATCTQLLLSPQSERNFIEKLDFYKSHIILRPIEITDCPEVIMRLGVLALNGAIEVDIYGHVNSSHIMGGDILSGVGGVSEFAMNAYLSVILLPSTTKNGLISCIVPMVAHVDISEHGVDVIVTEQGVADLRGLAPKKRAEKIIANCAHPMYKPLLFDYFQRAKKSGGGHQPQLMGEALSFQERLVKTGSMQ